MSDFEKLKIDFDTKKNLYKGFCEELTKELYILLNEKGVTLATPITHRVKEWDSLISKIEKYSLDSDSVNDINDFAGIRVISLFQRDIVTICEIITLNFDVIRMEDTSVRLQENQFGYGSIHFEVKFNEEWLKTPSFRKYHNLVMEIQVRTNAQHIWAATSHLLQYKQESSAPPPLRRSLNRTAALLELVDLEFERLLKERDDYIINISTERESSKLNIDILKNILETLIPEIYSFADPAYEELLINLTFFNINNKIDLTDLIEEFLEEAIRLDKKNAMNELKKIEKGESKEKSPIYMERLNKHITSNYVGLVRTMLVVKFGKEKYDEVAVSTKEFQENKIITG